MSPGIYVLIGLGAIALLFILLPMVDTVLNMKNAGKGGRRHIKYLG